MAKFEPPPPQCYKPSYAYGSRYRNVLPTAGVNVPVMLAITRRNGQLYFL
jgi:hypothetical protein